MPNQIIDYIELPGEQGSIFLYGASPDHVIDRCNLVRVNSEGITLWKAEPPNMEDHFTAMQWDGTLLTANSWSCYRVSVNLLTGQVTVLFFTK